MKAKIWIGSLLILLLTGCDDILDRPQLTDQNDDIYWTNEDKLRLYANGFYPTHFVAYNVGWSDDARIYLDYLFSDDIVNYGTQTQFELSVPTTRGTATATATYIPWLEKYTGPNWNFSWIRKSNIMIDRIENRMKDILTEEAYHHWMGIGRFFRAMDYAGLVTVFGDVPYYDHEVSDIDYDDLYKPRTPRNEVMDAVYEDWVYAIENVRLDDGSQYVNRYVVAGYISRLALFEGTWQKYHYNDTERAKKFLNLAVTAAEMIRTSGKFDIVTDFRSLFGSNDLSGNKDCIFYRHYDSSYSITHRVASDCNLTESRHLNPNLALIKSFICNDGTDWQTSPDTGNKDFSLDNLIKTRDPRFEASFWDKPTVRSLSSFLYVTKFISREGLSYIENGGTAPSSEYTSNLNENDYPLIRYAEVLLNLIEAKAELATLGQDAVTQSDIDMTINKIRDRPLAPEAEAKGVKKTAHLSLASLPDSPDRGDVSQLIWEIRRERRMELAFEHSRLLDLRRWKKLEYMDDTLYPDILKGTWVDLANDFPEQITAAKINLLAVTDRDGNLIVYDGTNADQMIGFYSHLTIQGRMPFLDVPGVNPYLAPVGINQMNEYATKGYVLEQTEGWPSGY
ncbi:MAG: RagB/SusD family nutrient uptake outer membrane protein [Bacteroides sp.]|nr:RagB/SusD family nutrient uptake outer membrane protein [Bacteroides sp.]